MKISIAGDHAGYEYKKLIAAKLEEAGHEVMDHGPYSTNSCDYPDFTHPLAERVATGLSDYGILICGSGNGVSITANKHQDIRSALAWTPEVASLARMHNDANVVSIPARFVEFKEAWSIVEVFLETKFEGGRHISRVKKIPLAD